MICKYCGTENEDDARICRYCGRRIKPAPERPDSRLFPDEDTDEIERYTDYDRETDETQIMPRRNSTPGFDGSKAVRDEVNRRRNTGEEGRQYYRYNPEEEARRAKKTKADRKAVKKQQKARPTPKKRHIGRTLMGLVFRAILGFAIGILLYVAVIFLYNHMGGILDNLNLHL